MTWAKVSVNNYVDGIQWCKDNLEYVDWVFCADADGSNKQFRFRDEAIAVEFALRF